MTDVDCFLPVASPESLWDFVELAQRAEATGYDRAWLPETWGRDAVTLLATIAERTERIGIGTSVTNVYTRSPALIGQTAATLQEVSDGRFRLGLGPSGPILVEGWHGVDYDRPLRRTRETIEVVREVLSGETVTYDGDIFNLAGFRLRSDPPARTPPIDAGGMGPTSVELAGRFADGWHALMLTPDGLRERLADLRRGADLGDRDPSEIRVTLMMGACVDEDPAQARDMIRNHLAFYVGAMGTFYREALAQQGYEDTALSVAQEWASGNYEAAQSAIGEELLADLAIVGTPEEAQGQLADLRAIEGVDAVGISFPRAADLETALRTVEALAPES
ncbi:MAG: TIGR04024 family LLM class F420-dependent oxidoreductase [Haloarculaceae archaeon]